MVASKMTISFSGPRLLAIAPMRLLAASRFRTGDNLSNLWYVSFLLAEEGLKSEVLLAKEILAFDSSAAPSTESCFCSSSPSFTFWLSSFAVSALLRFLGG